MSNIVKNSSFRPIAGWNEYVKEHYSIAQDALWWWKFHNKPINGAIYHNMRSSKSRLKYALRAVKRSEEAIRADAMASNLLYNDYGSFWTDVKKLNSSNAIISNLIDGTSGESNITNLWKKHFCNILNANTCDSDLKNEIMTKLENIQHTDSGSGLYSGGLTWSIVLRCDDLTGIFPCDGCARDPYFYVPAETQSYVIKLSCSRKVLAASGD